MNCLTVTEAGY